MAASMAGAVNTVHCVDGRLVGYNTDGRGMLESLSEDAGFSPEGKRVVLLGAGGAAGAAIVAFILGRAASVDVVSRDIARAEEIVARVEPHLKSTVANALTFDDAEQTVRDADLIVNATPLGMRADDPSPIPASWLRARAGRARHGLRRRGPDRLAHGCARRGCHVARRSGHARRPGRDRRRYLEPGTRGQDASRDHAPRRRGRAGSPRVRRWSTDDGRNLHASWPHARRRRSHQRGAAG